MSLVDDGGVAPLLLRSFGGETNPVGIPAQVIDHLRHQYQCAAANNLRYEATLAEMIERLRPLGVDMVLLKGLALANLHYPDPALRPVRDLDLFIRVRDFTAIRNLMREWKFEMEYPHEGEIPYLRGQKKFFQRSSHRVIQLHWEYINNTPLRAALGSDLASYRVWDDLEHMDVQGVSVNVLSLRRLLPYLCVHMACHHQFNRLLWVCDLHMLLTGSRRDEILNDILPGLARQEGLRPALHYSLKMTRALLGTPGLEQALRDTRPLRHSIRILCDSLRPADTLATPGFSTKMRRKLFREGLKLRDRVQPSGKRFRVALVSINMPRNYGLAVEYLKLHAMTSEQVKGCVSFRTLNVNRRVSRYLILAWIIACRPDVAGFSCYVWNVRKTLIVARLLKTWCPRTKIVLGGQEVTQSSIDFLEKHPFIDVVVDGEGEETFRDLLACWSSNPSAVPEAIQGIAYRHDGHVRKTADRPLIRNLDSIGSPYLNGAVKAQAGYRLGMMLEMCRGCRFRCTFCFEGKKYRGVRAFSVDRLEQEVNLLFASGARRFHLMDPILGNSDVATLDALFRIFQRLQELAPCEISVEVFAELLDEKTTPFMAPFNIFDVGIQSTNPQVLRNIRRVFQPEKFVRGVRLLKNLGGQVNFYLIMGLPGESPESYLEGVRYAVSLDPSYLFLNQLCVLNGTELRDRAEGLGLVYDSRPPYQIVETPHMRKEDICRLRIFSDALSAEHNLKIAR